MARLIKIANVGGHDFKIGAVVVAHQTGIDTVTLTAFDATDSFKLTYNAVESAIITRGTNATAAAIQAILRTLCSNNLLTVSGATDAGPFVVTYVDGGVPTALTVTHPVGCTGAVVRTNNTISPQVTVDTEDPAVRKALRERAWRYVVTGAAN